MARQRMTLLSKTDTAVSAVSAAGVLELLSAVSCESAARLMLSK